MGARLLIGGRRTDVNILIRSAGKQADVTLDLIRRKADKISDYVEGFTLQSLCGLCFVVDIRVDYPNILGKLTCCPAAVQKRELDSLPGGQLRDCCADGSGPSDK